jgi:predicted RNA-binding protein
LRERLLSRKKILLINEDVNYIALLKDGVLIRDDAFA